MKNLMNIFNSKSLMGCSRKLVLSTVIGSMAFIATNMAQAAQSTLPVDLSSATATKHEIAVLQVLLEVCPPMLNRQQKYNFQKTYNTQLRQMFPNIDNPKAAMRYLSTQQDYKTILTSMRNWTLSFSRDENMALCSKLANQDL